MKNQRVAYYDSGDSHNQWNYNVVNFGEEDATRLLAVNQNYSCNCCYTPFTADKNQVQHLSYSRQYVLYTLFQSTIITILLY